MGVSTLRDYMRVGGLPHFKLKGKILIKRSEFDQWIEKFRTNNKENINKIVSEIMESMKNG